MMRPWPPRRVAWTVAVVGLSLDLLIAFTTVLPNAPLLPQWPQFVVFLFAFVVHLRTVLLFADRRSHFREFFDSIPRATRLAYSALFIATWAIALVSIIHLSGQPVQHGDHYFLNDHGNLIPVTRAAYRHALVLQSRIFSLGPSVFFALGVIVHSDRTAET